MTTSKEINIKPGMLIQTVKFTQFVNIPRFNRISDEFKHTAASMSPINVGRVFCVVDVVDSMSPFTRKPTIELWMIDPTNSVMYRKSSFQEEAVHTFSRLFDIVS